MVKTEPDIRSQATRSVFWILAERWGGRLMSLVTFAVLGRLLAPEDFGLLALAAVFVAVLTIFVDAGFSQVLVQRETLTSSQISTAFWTSMGLAMLMYGTLAAAAVPLSHAYDQPKLAPVLWLLGLQLPVTALSSIPSALLIRTFAFNVLAIRSLSGVVVGTVAGLGAAFAGLGVWSLVIQTVGSSLVGCLMLMWRSSWKPTLEFDIAELREMWAFGVSILGTEVVNLVNAQADKLLVGSLLGPTALGYYYVGSRLVTLTSELLTAVIGRMSLTTFSRLQSDLARMMRAYYSATFASAVVALPAFGALAVLAPVIVPLAFGEQWGPSILVMQLLVPSSALVSVMYFDKSALLARGFSRDTFLLALANTSLGLVLIAVAAPFGMNAVALSRSLRQLLFWPVRQTVLRRRLGLDVVRYLAQFSKPLMGTGASSAVMWMILHWGPFEAKLLVLFVSGLAGAVVYVVVMGLVARAEMARVFGPYRLTTRFPFLARTVAQ